MHPDPLSILDLAELRTLEGRLRARLTALDHRVQHHLTLAGDFGEEDVAGIDVLCAAILEARELLGAVRREVLRRRAELAAQDRPPRRS